MLLIFGLVFLAQDPVFPWLMNGFSFKKLVNLLEGRASAAADV